MFTDDTSTKRIDELTTDDVAKPANTTHLLVQIPLQFLSASTPQLPEWSSGSRVELTM
jgi:hypothetical protein